MLELVVEKTVRVSVPKERVNFHKVIDEFKRFVAFARLALLPRHRLLFDLFAKGLPRYGMFWVTSPDKASNLIDIILGQISSTNFVLVTNQFLLFRSHMHLEYISVPIIIDTLVMHYYLLLSVHHVYFCIDLICSLPLQEDICCNISPAVSLPLMHRTIFHYAD